MHQIGFDIPSIALIVSIIGLTWSAFLALHRKGNRAANQYLALLIGVLTIFVLRRGAQLESEGLLLYLYFLSHGLSFVIGPSIYLHISTVIGNKTRKPHLHFIPFLVMSLMLTAAYFYRDQITAIQDTFLFKCILLSEIGIQVIHLISYLLMTRKLIRSLELASQNLQSTVPSINLKWSRGLLVITSILGGLILLLSILIITGGYYAINNTADGLFLITILIIIASLIFKSWNNPEIIYHSNEGHQKYNQSPLTNPVIMTLRNSLEASIQQEIYLKPDLTLQELSTVIDTKPYMLSQLLNESYQQNFFNFINEHRINYAKHQIQQGFLERQTVEALAYAAGFNSKSTFNRAFRKWEGQSPREYLSSIT